MEIKKYKYESKTYEKALELAKEALTASEQEIVVISKEEKEGLP